MKSVHLVSAAITLGVVRVAPAEHFAVTDLGTLPGDEQSEASGINNRGQVVGTALKFVNGVLYGHAFLYSDGQMQDLGTLGGNYSKGLAINNNGQVTGFSFTANTSHAFLYSNGAMMDLGTLPGGLGSAGYGINDSGQVVGYSDHIAQGYWHGFLYSDGKMMDLGGIGSRNSVANGINASGQAVGYSMIPSGAGLYFPVLFSGGTITRLDILSSGVANAINAAGQIVGARGDGGVVHAVIYASGVIADLGTLDGMTDSYATAINGNGQVVGHSTTRNVSDAFLYSGGKMLDLNGMIPRNSGWTLKDASGINDSGQIAGNGTDVSGRSVGFLLTPVPAGDADDDGRVDFADLVILARHYGLSAGATWEEGDFNGDGKVGFDDLTILARNYGQTLTAAQLAQLDPAIRVDVLQAFAEVPEPSSSALVSLAAVALLHRGRRCGTRANGFPQG